MTVSLGVPSPASLTARTQNSHSLPCSWAEPRASARAVPQPTVTVPTSATPRKLKHAARRAWAGRAFAPLNLVGRRAALPSPAGSFESRKLILYRRRPGVVYPSGGAAGSTSLSGCCRSNSCKWSQSVSTSFPNFSEIARRIARTSSISGSDGVLPGCNVLILRNPTKRR